LVSAVLKLASQYLPPVLCSSRCLVQQQRGCESNSAVNIGLCWETVDSAVTSAMRRFMKRNELTLEYQCNARFIESWIFFFSVFQRNVALRSFQQFTSSCFMPTSSSRGRVNSLLTVTIGVFPNDKIGRVETSNVESVTRLVTQKQSCRSREHPMLPRKAVHKRKTRLNILRTIEWTRDVTSTECIVHRCLKMAPD
jgi:hypothetical protein